MVFFFLFSPFRILLSIITTFERRDDLNDDRDTHCIQISYYTYARTCTMGNRSDRSVIFLISDFKFRSNYFARSLINKYISKSIHLRRNCENYHSHQRNDGAIHVANFRYSRCKATMYNPRSNISETISMRL